MLKKQIIEEHIIEDNFAGIIGWSLRLSRKIEDMIMHF